MTLVLALNTIKQPYLHSAAELMSMPQEHFLSLPITELQSYNREQHDAAVPIYCPLTLSLMLPPISDAISRTDVPPVLGKSALQDRMA